MQTRAQKKAELIRLLAYPCNDKTASERTLAIHQTSLAHWRENANNEALPAFHRERAAHLIPGEQEWIEVIKEVLREHF